MHVLLFLGGLIFLAAGTAALALSLGAYGLGGSSTFVTPGTVAAVGGFALLGLGAIAARLARLAEILETQPWPRNAGDAPHQATTRDAALIAEVVKVSSDAEAAKPAAHASARVAPPITLEPAPAAPAATLAAAVAPEVVSPARAEVQPASARDTQPENKPAAAAPMAAPSAPEPRAHTAPPAAEPRVHPAPAPHTAQTAEEESLHVLKSGVIEGMAYTLYSDGTVDAELPRHGTVRFVSIAQWRAFMRTEQ